MSVLADLKGQQEGKGSHAYTNGVAPEVRPSAQLHLSSNREPGKVLKRWIPLHRAPVCANAYIRSGTYVIAAKRVGALHPEHCDGCVQAGEALKEPPVATSDKPLKAQVTISAAFEVLLPHQSPHLRPTPAPKPVQN